MREYTSLPITSAPRTWPVRIIPSATDSPYTKPLHAADRSKPKPPGTPNSAWMRRAVAGKAWSGVLVARLIASTSAGPAPASSSAARAAWVPM